MKVRKTAFALLLILTFLCSLWESRNKAIAAVTKEEKSSSIQSTNIMTGENKEGYILLNKPKDKDKVEYLNARFAYNASGIYVDGTDPVPLEVFQNNEGYISLFFNQEYGAGAQEPGKFIAQVYDLGVIDFKLSEEPVYWKVVKDKGAYSTSSNELSNSDYIREFLPKSLDVLKGYLTVQDKQGIDLQSRLDIVPDVSQSTKSIRGMTDYIKADWLLCNEKLYQYVMEDANEVSNLIVTANYNFTLTLPIKNLYNLFYSTCSMQPVEELVIEGKLTFTNCFKIIL
jgi:hypothetical protein